ncbi:outer membrane lipoprotein chaperone LolA [Marinobacter sp. BGYM27]|uniref:outer membrane lipoprotein chaperone LolA n=1 Tax=Marinobacter sp. BGYM27 TaxID=2975597 RepID=UPI0021A737C9|nr:outer membrane lipoprotein chaperone LolA [Marinobacter sp. BGYM27]MDG5499097.1 outer membrane lipoprotein chaperone LolA [Marinobacter sp. BGYM27]
MKRSLRLWLVMLSSLMLSWAGVAAAEGGKDATARLAEKLATYRTFQADFIQVVVDGGGDKVQETRGSLKAKRPGLFYWKSEQPFAQTIAADGKNVEVYDPDLEQVTVKPMDSQMSSTPALLLSGEVSNLAEAYNVTEKVSDKGYDEYVLEPKNSDSLFVSLRLRFRDGSLSDMRLRDSLGQISILSFQDVKVNEAVADSVFKLEYPDSVDVISSKN